MGAAQPVPGSPTQLSPLPSLALPGAFRPPGLGRVSQSPPLCQDQGPTAYSCCDCTLGRPGRLWPQIYTPHPGGRCSGQQWGGEAASRPRSAPAGSPPAPGPRPLSVGAGRSGETLHGVLRKQTLRVKGSSSPKPKFQAEALGLQISKEDLMSNGLSYGSFSFFLARCNQHPSFLSITIWAEFSPSPLCTACCLPI